MLGYEGSWIVLLPHLTVRQVCHLGLWHRQFLASLIKVLVLRQQCEGLVRWAWGLLIYIFCYFLHGLFPT